MGQRSQYQSQGAAQAPLVTQVGQRGQVMGRGRGRGPQAEMSEDEALEEPLYVSSSLGIRARIGMICQGCELEISEILLTVDLRVMDMSEFDIILGMDWLIAYRVVIDCERRRVTAYTQDSTCDDPRAQPNPVGRSEPKPRGRPTETINQIRLSNTFHSQIFAEAILI